MNKKLVIYCLNVGKHLMYFRETLRKIQDYEKSRGKISEIDTQVLLVEPVLCLAGYNIYDPFVVKRASCASSSREFDVEVYNKEGELALVIEVKALFSGEFNIDDIDKEEAGILSFNYEKGKWENENGDGVGQLRAYCINWCCKLNEFSIPILTNGKKWVFFDLKEFRKYPRRPVSSNMCLVLCIENEEDFQKIIDILKSGYKKLQKFLKNKGQQ